MATKLYEAGGTAVTIPGPDKDKLKRRLLIGSSQRMLDGSLTHRRLAKKWRWELRWSQLTGANRDTLVGQLELDSQLSWEPPNDGGTFTVLVSGDVDIRMDDSSQKYNVTANLEEV